MEDSVRCLSMALILGAALVLGGCGGGGENSAGSPLERVSNSSETSGQEASSAPATVQGTRRSELALGLAAPGDMKWNPGHYVVFQADEGEYAVDSGLDETAHLPFVKGIVVRSYWRQLEREKNVYHYWRIDRFLNKAAARDKRFFLLLSLRSFSAENRVAPDYLYAPLYDGGVYHVDTHKNTQGEAITLWNDHTRYRVIKLIQALAARYNGHPHFEGVILSETAFGYPVKPVTEEQKARYYANFARVDTAARAAFPNTVVIQFVNFPRQYTPAIVSNLLAQGVGFGTPDVFVADDDHEKYVYPFNEQVHGQIPIGMQVESDSYYFPSGHGPYAPPDVKDLYTLASGRLHSNYVFWERDLRPPYRAWTKVLAMFNSPEFPATPTGGLEATCPSKFTRCVGQEELARAVGTGR